MNIRSVEQTETVLNALLHFFPRTSKNTLRSWIKEGRIFVEGRQISQANTLIEKGNKIEIRGQKKFLEGNIEIIYQDSDIIVIDKPSGLLSVSTHFEKEETVHQLLKRKFRGRKIYVVHRLDQDTSGVMVFALNERAAEAMKKLFERHDIDREYAGIVEGRLEQKEGTWKSYLFEDGNYFVHSTTNPLKGEEAITHYKVKKETRTYSLLAINLETGKKNQIRVHCKEAGNPIVGDVKYGAKSNPIGRLCLHAHFLGFLHPFSKKKMKFTSKIPEQFLRIVPL